QTNEGITRIVTAYEMPDLPTPRALEHKAEYIPTVDDFLRARGMVPAKTTYDLEMTGLKKGTIRIHSKRPMITDLEKTIMNTEEHFMRINNLTEKDMNEEIKYNITALSENGKSAEIPRSLYKSMTIHGKKSTITY
ncbi:MAG TPA: hypothetical protein V6C58_26330, partial [Allocoleopsis sp.]